VRISTHDEAHKVSIGGDVLGKRGKERVVKNARLEFIKLEVTYEAVLEFNVDEFREGYEDEEDFDKFIDAEELWADYNEANRTSSEDGWDEEEENDEEEDDEMPELETTSN